MWLWPCAVSYTHLYVNGNVGSGTVQEMSEWVEYMTFDLSLIHI